MLEHLKIGLLLYCTRFLRFRKSSFSTRGGGQLCYRQTLHHDIYIIIISLTIVMTGTAGSFGGWRKWAPDSSTPLSPSTWAACAKKLNPLHHHHHHQHCDRHHQHRHHHHHLEHHQHVYENLGAALYADAGWWSIAGVYHFTEVTIYHHIDLT